jgi:hypothetical protein
MDPRLLATISLTPYYVLVESPDQVDNYLDLQV